MERILVVDNDKLFLEMMNDFLSKEGHEVVTAEDGLSALDILKTYTPDVVFVDLIMPKIGGKKLCKIIRKVKRLKDVFLIVLSSFVSELEADIADLEIDGYIPKGPLHQMMRDVINALVEVDNLSLQRSLEEVVETEDEFEGRAKEELLASKRHFESIVERSSEGIVEITSEGRVVYANEAALSLIDMPEDKLLGSHFIELFTEDDRQRAGEFLTPIGDRPKVITEDSPVILKGRQVTVDVMPMEGDEPTAVLVLNEVGKRIRAEIEVQVDQGLPEKGIREETERLREEIKGEKRKVETLPIARDELQRQVKKKTYELTKENERLRKEVEEGRRETETLHRAHGALLRQIERETSEPSKENGLLREQESESKRKTKKLQRDYEKLQRQMKKKTSELSKANERLKVDIEEGKRETEKLQSSYDKLQRQMKKQISEPSKENGLLRDQASESKRKTEKLQRQMKKKTSELSKANERLKEEIRAGKRETETLQRAHDALQRQIERQTIEPSKENELLREQASESKRKTEKLQRDHEKLQRQMKKKTSELSKANERLKEEIRAGKRETETLQSAYDKLQRQMKKQISELSKVNRLLEKEMENRRRTEKAIQQTEEKSRTIFRSLEESYYEVDTSGNFTFFNNSMRRMLGYSDSELLGMNARQVMDEDNAERVFKSFDSVMKTGKPAKTLDWELLRKDGSKRVVQASVILMLDSEGQPMGFRGIIRDEGERRLAKEERFHREKLQAALEKVHNMCRALDREVETNFESCKNILSEMPEDDPSFEGLKTIKEQAARMNNTTAELIKFSSVQTRILFQALSSSQSRSN